MNRPHYLNHRAGIYMYDRFGMRFTAILDDAGCELRLSKGDLLSIRWRFCKLRPPLFIAEDSLHMLKPKTGDRGLAGEREVVCRQDGGWPGGLEAIITHRDGKPFAWPPGR